MASPDEARVDEARDHSSVPDPASTTSTGTVPTSDEPASPAPQRRPRGAASFPGVTRSRPVRAFIEPGMVGSNWMPTIAVF